MRPFVLGQAIMTMRRRNGWIRIAAVAAIAFVVSPFAVAGSSTDNGAPFSINQALRFQINYPSFLRFQVGSAGAVIDVLDFNVPGVITGTSVPVSATGGNAGPSAVSVSVVANTGVVTISATNNSGGTGMGTGAPADGYINYNQIGTSSSDATNLPAPALANAGATSVPVAVTSGVVTMRSAVWTFAFANSVIPNPGIYGTSVNGGRVTYTAATP